MPTIRKEEMLILIANSKGGSHKTSLATSILAELAKDNAVVGVDLDGVNKAASKWSESRDETQGKFYYLEGKIEGELARVREQFDHVVVDAGGFDNIEIRTAVLLADIILIPLKIGSLDNIEGFRNIVDLIYEFQPVKTIPSKAYGVVVGAKAVGGGAEAKRAFDEIKSYDVITPAKSYISDRIWYGRAIDARLGLTEYESPEHKDKRLVDMAKNESKQLIEEIMQ